MATKRATEPPLLDEHGEVDPDLVAEDYDPEAQPVDPDLVDETPDEPADEVAAAPADDVDDEHQADDVDDVDASDDAAEDEVDAVLDDLDRPLSSRLARLGLDAYRASLGGGIEGDRG